MRNGVESAPHTSSERPAIALAATYAHRWQMGKGNLATSGRTVERVAQSKVAQAWFSSLRLLIPQRLEPQSYRLTLRYCLREFFVVTLSATKGLGRCIAKCGDSSSVGRQPQNDSVLRCGA